MPRRLTALALLPWTAGCGSGEDTSTGQVASTNPGQGGGLGGAAGSAGGGQGGVSGAAGQGGSAGVGGAGAGGASGAGAGGAGGSGGDAGSVGAGGEPVCDALVQTGVPVSVALDGAATAEVGPFFATATALASPTPDTLVIGWIEGGGAVVSLRLARYQCMKAE